MENFFKNGGTKFLIAILAVIAICFFLYIFFDNKSKADMTLVVEKRPIQARLLEVIENDGFFVNIQDTKTSEKFEGIFVSKLCPLSEKNRLGKVMDINKLVLYKVKDDIKTTSFEGIYEYLCTDKKDTPPAAAPAKN
jgi:hypothetical protein